ncbi:MAG: hypothetical protein C4532_09495 [Candidatus Abyssobacteria bacterium SURF_17]|uniref:DUF2148 domain-containing protein n=1 Tax=Candidatus Abyssobacteria bacterium SURF_17 TaxID=2093361 RepID=A0A419EZ44_9BACT|nr:MAG: hypothetical protein C4532_09495 [Candidatus Abyssubacteria bacterium SURF_17]
MAYYDGKKLANEGLLSVAQLCAMAALKAPQMTGTTEVKVEILTGEDLDPLIEVLGILGQDNTVCYGDNKTLQSCKDKGTVPVVMLIGGIGLGNSGLDWDCGACGFATCKEHDAYLAVEREKPPDFTRPSAFGTPGPVCVWKAIDVGMAMDWAAATAFQHNIENRAMASVGVISQALGYLATSEVSIGICLGPCEPEVYYNRPSLKEQYDKELVVNYMMRAFPTHFMGFPGTGDPRMKYSAEWETDARYVRVAKREEVAQEKKEAGMARVMQLIMETRAKIAERAASEA